MILATVFFSKKWNTDSEDTWGWYWLEATEQGLEPDYTLVDAGKGLRAGHKAVWKNVPCHGDVWHIFDQGETLGCRLAKKAQGATTQRGKLETQIEKANLKSIRNPLSAKLTKALKNEQKLLKLASDVKILVYWLRMDVLSLAGAHWQERRELMDFVIDELKIRETQEYKGIKALRVALSHQKDDLLAFAHLIDEKLTRIA